MLKAVGFGMFALSLSYALWTSIRIAEAAQHPLNMARSELHIFWR
ncbi:hypothetical protein R2A130_1963 [Ahrensia sp. R2A130]|nr:hypothetical protein R2A130_1963 [Ahrensia sp. R2A130]